MSGIGTVVIVAAVMACVLGGITLLAHIYNLNHIKSKTVGDGQHGTARWATRSEIVKTYRQIPFTPQKWREQAMRRETPTVTPLKNGGKEKPVPQGIVVGCRGGKDKTVAMVDTGDVHALMIGAAGVGKTAYWLYPCIEYACASGMSFLSTDTKGDVMRNYGTVARQYGYNVSVIDLRNPTRSNGNPEHPYTVSENANRKVEYADKKEIVDGIVKKYRPDLLEEEEDTAGRCLPGGMSQTESRMHEAYRRSEKAVPIRTAPPGRRGNE